MAVAAAVFAWGLSSCTKEPVATNGSIQIQMDYVWAMDMQSFELNTPYLHPMSGDSLEFTTFKHYISHVRLQREDGTYWDAPESFYLLDASEPSSLQWTIEEIPGGNYKGLQITLGVDSLRNVSGAQTGALDPANNMFWSWNSGYIMIKAEGTSPQSSSGSFAYHLGGFSGANNAISVRDFAFPDAAVLTVSEETNPLVTLMANPARLFHTYGSVSNGSTVHMPGPAATQMADDFNSWVRLSALEQ